MHSVRPPPAPRERSQCSFSLRRLRALCPCLPRTLCVTPPAIGCARRASARQQAPRIRLSRLRLRSVGEIRQYVPRCLAGESHVVTRYILSLRRSLKSESPLVAKHHCAYCDNSYSLSFLLPLLLFPVFVEKKGQTRR